MNVGLGTVLIGGGIGLALAAFGARMLLTGRMPAATGRSFRNVRDAGLYHLLFGLALVILAVGSSLPGHGIPGIVSAVLAVGMVGVAVVKHRPRGRKTADHD
jgi:hypothetical protein